MWECRTSRISKISNNYTTRKRFRYLVVLEYNLSVKNVKIVRKLAALKQCFRFCQHRQNIFKDNCRYLQGLAVSIVVEIFLFLGCQLFLTPVFIIFSFSPREGACAWTGRREYSAKWKSLERRPTDAPCIWCKEGVELIVIRMGIEKNKSMLLQDKKYRVRKHLQEL